MTVIFTYLINVNLGKTKSEANKLAAALILNKLMLTENKNLKISDFLNDKMTKDNAPFFFSLAKLYKLATAYDLSLSYIERCFSMVIESQNFLHLDFNLVVKILDSSELNVQSEVQIFNAANIWLSYNTKERKNYAKQLLLKVRLNLLSEYAIKYILKCKSPLSGNHECVKILKEVLATKNLFQKRSSISYTNRFCCQNKFNILIYGGYNLKKGKVLKRNVQFYKSNLNIVKPINPMANERLRFKAVCLKGEVYVFSGPKYGTTTVVEKYSFSSNTWNKVTCMSESRDYFCACAFMNHIFMFGGCHDEKDFYDQVTYSCLNFNTNENKLKEICKMNIERMQAACVVFQGNIIVTGGRCFDRSKVNSVESYDVFGNKWAFMPDMINRHSDHSSVAVKDKLFVISHKVDTCEVFDNVVEKFVSLKHPHSISYNKCVAISNRIVVFQEFSSSIIFYDVDKDEWSKKLIDVKKYLKDCFCVKIPQY